MAISQSNEKTTHWNQTGIPTPLVLIILGVGGTSVVAVAVWNYVALRPTYSPEYLHAKAELEQLGAKFEYFTFKRSKTVCEVTLHGCRVTDEDLSYLEHIGCLTKLDLGRTQITDGGMTHLQHQPYLKTLMLQDTRITDVGVRNLYEMQYLKTLDISNTEVTGQGMIQLQQKLPDCTVVRAQEGVTTDGTEQRDERES